MNILKKITSFVLSGVMAFGALALAVPASFGQAAAAENKTDSSFSSDVTINLAKWYKNTPRFYAQTSAGYSVDAFCVDPSLPPGFSKQKSFSKDLISGIEDKTVLNILYYGYNAPGIYTENDAFYTGKNSTYAKTPYGAMMFFRNRDNLLPNYSVEEYIYTFTHYAVSYAMYGADKAFGSDPNWDQYNYRKAVPSYVSAIRNNLANGKLPDKSAFLRAYLITNPNLQNIIFPVYKMRLEFNKASMNPDFTDGNSAYSLDGAEFVLFQNNADAAEKAVKELPETEKRREGAMQNADGKLSYIYTNADGKGYFKNTGYDKDDVDYAIVDIDNYSVIEYKSPVGYSINNNAYRYVDSGRIDENGFPIYVVDSAFEDKNGTPSFPNMPKMALKMTKRPSDETITSGNTCYSLEGAVYHIFTDADCTQPFMNGASITTDSEGNGSYLNGQTVDGQRLWVKETQAPKGFALDTNKYEFTFSGQRDADGYPIYTFTSIEKPETDPITVLLQKYDATTGKGTNTEKLANAEFTVKFYPSYYYSVEEIGDTQPLRSWVFKTNKNGKIQFDERDKVSGDEFWYDEGYPTIPYGTITVQETKAPTGYQINPEIYLANIDDTNGNISWRTTNENIDANVLQVAEAQGNGGLAIYKTASDNIVAGIWFRVSAEGYSKDFYTDKNGLIINDELSNLPVDREYTIEELGERRANGRYYFPRRYGTKPDPVTVRLQAGTTTPVYFRNECIPSELNVIKTSDDNRIRSIYFSVTDSKGTQYPLLVTDNTGKAQIKNLPVYDRSDMPITYTVTELGYYVSEGVYTIPDRYAKPEPQSFTLLDDSADAVKSVMFHNSVVVGSVSLNKRTKSGSGLAGSQWALFTKDNQQVAFAQMGIGRYLQTDSGTIATLSTDSTGYIKISSLPYGDYYFMEVQAPTGYMPYGEKLYFTVSDEEKEVSLTVTDNVAVMYNTGSIGTAPIYIAGAAALTFVGAAIFVYRILKKKKSIKQNQNRSEK